MKRNLDVENGLAQASPGLKQIFLYALEKDI
jgi:hypothetical protein